MYLFMPVCWLYCLSVCLFFGCTILAMDFEFIMFVRAYSALSSACCDLCVCTSCAILAQVLNCLWRMDTCGGFL